MSIQLIQVPYDSGHRGIRLGKGPLQFVDQGIARILSRQGHSVEVECLEVETDLMNPIKTAFEVNRLLARLVKIAIEFGKFPLVLAGNCNTCVGSIAGLHQSNVGVIWFDAHGDFNTPETSYSGYLDGMALALATGDCWQGMVATIPGFIPVAGNRIVHIGARNLDPKESDRFSRAGASLVDSETLHIQGIRKGLEAAFQRLKQHTKQVYVHLDMDIVDPDVARSKDFAPSGGLTVEQTVEVLMMIKDYFHIRAATIAACDPHSDQEGRAIKAGMTFAQVLVPEGTVTFDAVDAGSGG